MSKRQFEVGELVRFERRATNAAAGSYRILRRLPESDGDFRYRIKSERESHERVASGYELVEVTDS